MNPQSEVGFYRLVNLFGSTAIFLILTWSIGIFTVDWKVSNSFYVTGALLSLLGVVTNYLYFRFFDFNRHYQKDDNNRWTPSKLFPYMRGVFYGRREILQGVIYFVILLLQLYLSSILF